MSLDIVSALFASFLSLAIVLAITALIRGATQIVRGWDALADGRR